MQDVSSLSERKSQELAVRWQASETEGRKVKKRFIIKLIPVVIRIA